MSDYLVDMPAPELDTRDPAPARFVALALSVALHVGVAMLALVLARHATAHAAAHPERPDVWSGDTFDIDGLVRGAPPAPTSGATAAQAAKPEPKPEPAAKRAPKPEPAAQSAPKPERVAKPEAADRDRAAVASASPKPRKRPRHHAIADGGAPQRTASAPDRQTQSPADGGAPVAAAGGGTFGAAGLPPGVRDLGKAFARALPRASSGDALWSSLPLGDAGTFHVVITVDGGHISDARAVEDDPPAQLAHLLARTVMLLRGGVFALPSGEAAGTEKLRISVTISEGAASDQIDVNPADTVALGYEPPTAQRPGRGWFTLASGRHVEAKIYLDPSR